MLAALQGLEGTHEAMCKCVCTCVCLCGGVEVREWKLWFGERVVSGPVCLRTGLLEQGLLATNCCLKPQTAGISATEARLMFAWSQMVVVDELKLRRRAVSLQVRLYNSTIWRPQPPDEL